jgi:hypothetical protein
VAALAHAALYVLVVAPLINGVGHWRGAQNFANTAYNSAVLAWVTGGESLHNNHHAHPRSPKFSVRRSEFDPSWLVIRALAAVKLVVIVGTSSPPSADDLAVNLVRRKDGPTNLDDLAGRAPNLRGPRSGRPQTMSAKNMINSQ